MIVALLDTNTIVSGIILPRGVPYEILEAARSQQFVLATSPAIVAEVLATLSRDKIRDKYRVTADDMERLRALLEHEALVVDVTREVRGIATHPEDDLVLAAAASAQVDYLVTGDKKLQQVKTYAAVTIVSPREFLETAIRIES